MDAKYFLIKKTIDTFYQKLKNQSIRI